MFALDPLLGKHMGRLEVIRAALAACAVVSLAACAGAPDAGLVRGGTDGGAQLRQALIDLETLPAPQGADPTTFAVLKAELRKLLLALPAQKSASAAPGSKRSKVADLTAAAEQAGARFHWSYKNEGDFDQGGIVGIGDLTPLGIHFGKDAGAPDWASARLADGNENGKVELGDLVSIGANFHNLVARYELQRRDFSAGEDSFTAVATCPFNASHVASGELRQFDFVYSAALPGVYRVVPCDTASAGIPSNEAAYYGADAGPWPMDGHDAQHTRCSPITGPQTAALKWKYRTTGIGCSFYEPCVAPNGALYVRSDTGGHYAINPDGTQQWLLDEWLGYCRPAFGADGTAYFNREDMICAINPDASTKWTCQLPGAGTLTPTVAPDGTVYAVGDALYAIAPNGALKWTYDIAHAIESYPAVAADGTVYFGGLDYKFYALGPDGSLKWMYDTQHNMQGCTPVLGADGTIYFCGINLFALNPDGSEKWIITFDTPGVGWIKLADGGKIYATGQDKLYTVGLDGTVQSSFTAPAQLNAGATLGPDGTIYLSCKDKRLYAFNPAGAIQWTVDTGSYQCEFTVDANSSVYFSDSQGRLTALGPDGSVKWVMGSGGRLISSPTIGADGAVYITGMTSNLYAINPDGSLRWFKDALWGSASGIALGAGGAIYAGSYEAYPASPIQFYAIDRSGARKWSYTADFSASPVVGADQTVYFGAKDGSIHALYPDGGVRWTYPAGLTQDVSPALGLDGTVYFGDGDNRLTALNPDGSLKWIADTDPVYQPSPAIGRDGTIFTIAADKLLALDPEGKVKWTYPAQPYYPQSNMPAIGMDGTVYIMNADGASLNALTADGALLWTFTDTEALTAAPIVDGAGTVYICCGHKLNALSPAGVLRWSFESASYFSDAPAIAADGALIAGCDDCYVYAFAAAP
jgi:outer membrane protein assembly factor BamB